MDDVAINKLKFYETQKKATQQLAEGRKKRSSIHNSDPLIAIASKRSTDTINLTYMMLKIRLTRDLDETIAAQLKAHPELRDEIYIGIIRGESYSTEVIKIDDAAKAVEGMAEGAARAQLLRSPVGYYAPDNFTMKTPEESKYQEFKRALDKYFTRNQEVIQYLSSHPEANVTATSLYKAPQ